MKLYVPKRLEDDWEVLLENAVKCLDLDSTNYVYGCLYKPEDPDSTCSTENLCIGLKCAKCAFNRSNVVEVTSPHTELLPFVVMSETEDEED